MKGILGYKLYKTVIMDGSDEKMVKNIISIFEMATGRRLWRIKSKAIDKEHPTMREFFIFTNANTYHDARRIVNQYHPGVCNFDVPI